MSLLTRWKGREFDMVEKKTWIHSLSNRHRLQSWLGSQLNCGCKFCTISIHMEGL